MLYKEGVTSRFLAFWPFMTTATFAYLGTEPVGVAVGEAQYPRKTIPKAIKPTFFRIPIFYILSVFLLGILAPYNSKNLIFVTMQPTTQAPLPLSLLLAVGSDLYFASHTLYRLAREGDTPAFLAWTGLRPPRFYTVFDPRIYELQTIYTCSVNHITTFGLLSFIV
ncbi:hypothetical protein EW145_g2923 [Phellinidium pouzarii]|uniref:Amino acid permease/ SLC12A domain-containing protein n=1 Tax=Phellinidium pouzarii TaxID=167371 RepID=A0A4V3XD28_9AGAM|nr:hypothetical protein EW145_g2923 [Phellinidium pouzarii]